MRVPIGVGPGCFGRVSTDTSQATTAQTSSPRSVAGQPGMPVIFTPFSTIQCSSFGCQCATASVIAGGSGTIARAVALRGVAGVP